MNESSVTSIPSTSPNHVRYVESLSAPLSRPATSVQRLSAVSSIGCSTRPARLLHRRQRGPSIAASREPHNGPSRGRAAGEKAPICRAFGHIHRLSTGVDRGPRKGFLEGRKGTLRTAFHLAA